ncbi:DUF4124 domain-containing protein [Acidovorax sp.]|uniref:DUF4124 domain-containing protein n=1 Tax=Acidovorax sp. TaxID=1872122 RepID=UPI0025B8CDBB|nr:DUF4124 domain-containing protein [Acidovorax sp.]
MIRASALCVALLTVAMPGWAINKCVGSDGRAVFQDSPCAGKGEKIDVRPASGNAPAALAQPTSAQPARPTPAKEGAFGESWQRRTYLENRGIADARGALQAHKMQCDARQRELSAQKGQASNNLAGATWLQAIATEMQAAATLCDSKQRDLQAQLDGLEKELRELQAKQ